MRSFDFVLLATVLFLELLHKLVLYGSFSSQTVIFFAHVHYPDHPAATFVAPSHDDSESCVVNIGICLTFALVDCYLC